MVSGAGEALRLDDGAHGERRGVAEVDDALVGSEVMKGEPDRGRALILHQFIRLDHPALALQQEAPHRRMRAASDCGGSRALTTA